MHYPTEPIAIIGSSCRFPGGANTPSKLWELLKEPRDLLEEIPPSRFNPNAFYHPDGEHHGTTNVRHAYLLPQNPSTFDNQFFAIHPKEAEAMDPQHRILLETVYESLESAGCTLHSLRGSATGVFVGQMGDDYHDALLRDVPTIPRYFATGTARSITSNRISYFFDLKGPSVTIDTACSSSLVAVHQAVQELRYGDSRLAIVGGVNLILSPDPFVVESKLHMLSPGGRSRMWDAGADGYARGEGFAAVVLKTLSRALKDGDHVECVIRESGVGQDGRTRGITLPSARAQAELIRRTYERAGLDWRGEGGRCQYFEAHGTGTLAGDPVEAEAIRDVFFPDAEGGGEEEDGGELLVGSIKTVVGHLEGTAGLAGLLKAKLSVQHGVVTPNLLFERLNPAVRPFYGKLRVASGKAQPWPVLPEGVPRRASVNSFGFGGTNAHVILESWDEEKSDRGDEVSLVGPFVLSASTEGSLKSSIAALAGMLKESPDIRPQDLSWTLQSHRSEFQYKAAFAASTREQLIEKLAKSTITKATKLTEKFPLRILGVFTGQGAQWPAMGAGLFHTSTVFRESILHLEAALKFLPDGGPSWLLSTELTATGKASRVHEAAISQPLTTAVQIALVDLVRSYGLEFSAVVGHSSGEIAATYAAGYLSKADAIKVSYYRGRFAGLAGKGKMMAVGMSFDQAVSFCEGEPFEGRITLAASNSPSSVTLSGDADAINEAKRLLDERGVFCRVLRVDTAYHSHHVDACVGPYLEALRGCDIQVDEVGGKRPRWFSSVYGPDGRRINRPETFRDTYWADNMRKSVLFSQALSRAVTEYDYCFDVALEVGPHASLRGPATECLRTLTGVDIPYSGLLKRGCHDADSFSEAIGFVWSRFLSSGNHPVVDFVAGRSRDQVGLTIVKNLPPYQWDHDSRHWLESRKSKEYRTRSKPINELIGVATTHGGGHEIRWRNLLKLNEMEWLRGHQFQGQVLFPAAGYVAMAYEAAMNLAEDLQVPVCLVELEDMVIHRAITLEEHTSGADVSFVVRVISKTSRQIIAEYACYSGDASDQVKHNFEGRVVLTLGEATPDTLPARVISRLPQTPIDVDRFYKALEKVGLQYSGDFVASSVHRRLDMSTVTAHHVQDSKLRVHPASLDALFHGLFAAFCDPDDERMWTSYLPTAIKMVRINPQPCPRGNHSISGLIADSHISFHSARTIRGDINIFCAAQSCNHAEIQVHRLTCSSFASPTAQQDRRLYYQDKLVRDVMTCGLSPADKKTHLDTPGPQLREITERTSHFYFRRLREEISYSEIPSLEPHFQQLMHWVTQDLLPSIDRGQHPHIRPEHANDTLETIHAWENTYRHSQIDMEIIAALGESLPDIVRGKLPALQLLMKDQRLAREYRDGLGFREANIQLGRISGQLSHRYPRMKILEIGAGTGGATRQVLGNLAGLESYTFTDISSGFFEAARGLFAGHVFEDKMEYKVLDIEKEISSEEWGEFDMIVASCVLHATRNLEKTLWNCKRLLRPGGCLMLLEVVNPDLLGPGFIFGTLAGWWLGREDGRVKQPTITEGEWNSLLLRTGFSGVDSACRDNEGPVLFLSVMMSQAVDERVLFLREPLDGGGDGLVGEGLEEVVIIGRGKELNVARTAGKMKSLLRGFCGRVSMIDGLEDVVATWKPQSLPSKTGVICLADMDTTRSIFQDLNEETFRGLQMIFSEAFFVLWTTQRGRANPWANMIVGLGRSVQSETPSLQLQIFDVGGSDDEYQSPLLATRLSEAFLRMVSLGQPEFEGIMWSNEHELFVEKGVTYIPRIVANEVLNDRLNSERRPILYQVSPVTHVLEISGLEVCVVDMDWAVEKDGMVEIQVSLSTLRPLEVDGKRTYICMGHDTSGRLGVALSPTNASKILVAASDFFEIGGREDLKNAEWVREVVVGLYAESIVTCNGDKEKSLWVHGNGFLSQRITEVATTGRYGRNLSVFLTHSDAVETCAIGTFIHPFITNRDLEVMVPRNIGAFVNTDQETRPELHNLFLDVLGSEVDVYNLDPIPSLPLDYARLCEILKKSIRELSISECTASTDSLENIQVTLDSLKKLPPSSDPTLIVNWQHDDSCTISLPLKPTNTTNLFSANATYFLVGLTGDLGLSLLFFMQSAGARHIALASRRPSVNEAVLDELARKGLNVRVFSLDISDHDSLLHVYHEISSTMPPIAGVINAAMVLRDSPLSNMSWDDFTAVQNPKVKGTINLDTLFHSTPLEFFILFSSLSSVVGWAGQGNYGAANMFMASLARQRRARGLAASCIDIAKLLSVGYIARSAGQYEGIMSKYRFMAISEPEFHAIFAEAIAVGRLERGRDMDVEIITGLGVDETEEAPWLRDARFSHFVVESGDGRGGEGKMQTLASQGYNGQRLSEVLLEGDDEVAALEVLEASFKVKLGLITQAPAEQLDADVSLMQLGIDSLIAVEIRSWFIKEVGVDMPVLRILGGLSIRGLCKDAIARIWGDRVPPVNESPPQSSSSGTLATPSRDSSESSAISVDTNVSTPSSTPASPSGGELQHVKVPVLKFARTGEMSHSQARLYFLHQYLEDKTSYNTTFVGTIRGVLDINRLKTALQRVANKHEGLRTAFLIDQQTGKAMQAVHDDVDYAILFDHRKIESKEALSEAVSELTSFEYNLEHGQGMKVVIVSCQKTNHILVGYHHLVLDGVSHLSFLKDLDLAYSDKPLGRVQQAIDLAARQRIDLVPSKLQTELNFWTKTFQNAPETIPLFPFSKVKSRRILTAYDTEELVFRVETNLAERIKRKAAELGVTAFHFYLSALAALIARTLEIRDFSLGVMDANRQEVADYDTIGCFLNPLPVRFKLDQESFRDVARQTRDNILGVLANSRVPFDTILDHVDISRSSNQHPLFQIAANWRSGFSTVSKLGNCNIDWTSTILARNPYDLVVDYTDMPEYMNISFITQRYLYDTADSNRLAKWYVQALEGFASDTSLNISDCPVANTHDIQEAISLGRYRGNTKKFDWPETISHQIDAIANLYPNSIAIKDQTSGPLTYAQMMNRVNQISTALLHAKTGSFVGLLLIPSPDLVCSLLALLRLGLTYVPLDLRNPQQRLSSIVEDCHPSVIISNPQTHHLATTLASSSHPTTTTILNLSTLPVPTPHTNIPNRATPTQPAFLIYTSGTTGTPKGILHRHSSMLNQIRAVCTLYNISRTDIILQQSAYSFDASLEQLLVPLAIGGTMVIVPAAAKGDPMELARIMCEEGVTVTIMTPSEYGLLMRYSSEALRGGCKSWRWAFSGGERVTGFLRGQFAGMGIEGLGLVNGYGPAEVCVSCARGVVDYEGEGEGGGGGDSSAGGVLPGYEVVIVDEKMRVVPVGFAGEICIAGSGLAVGYLNREEETRESFVELEFLPGKVERFYRSGDRGRLLDGGELQFMGRITGGNQVKFHGIRIELDEISELMIRTFPYVLDAAATMREPEVLGVYVVLEEESSPRGNDILGQLLRELPLPVYMKPAYIMTVGQIPRNPNGKRDQSAVDRLPMPEAIPLADIPEMDLTDLERKLRDIWVEVLGEKVRFGRAITATSDFFYVGGNSHSLIALKARLGALGWRLSLPELVKASTLRSLAGRIELLGGVGVSSEGEIKGR